MSDANEYLPKEGEYNPLADDAATGNGKCDPKLSPVPEAAKKKSVPQVQLFTPSQLRAYEPPSNQNMVGDFHLQRGSPTVLAGPPGCGKSRATLWLAVLGALGKGNWFGLRVNCKFRTLIIQCENNLARLHRDFNAIQDANDLDDWIRITSFPPYRTFRFDDRGFREALKAMIREFKPELVIIDPWNRVAKDSMQKDFQEALEHVCEVMEEFPDAACLILHHLRKPKTEDRQKGRGLANLLSGSNVLEGAARAVLVMQPASDDVEDGRVVVTTAKNNDGEHGKRTAWERKAGWFEAVEDFDFEEFDSSGARHEAKVCEEHLREVFGDGQVKLPQKQAMERLQEVAGVGRTAAYEALKLKGGRFSALLVRDEENKLIKLRPPAPDSEK